MPKQPRCYDCKTAEAVGASAYCADCDAKIKARIAARNTGWFSGLPGLAPRGVRIRQCPNCRELFSGETTLVLHRVEAERVSGHPGEYWLTDAATPSTRVWC